MGSLGASAAKKRSGLNLIAERSSLRPGALQRSAGAVGRGAEREWSRPMVESPRKIEQRELPIQSFVSGICNAIAVKALGNAMRRSSTAARVARATRPEPRHRGAVAAPREAPRPSLAMSCADRQDDPQAHEAPSWAQKKGARRIGSGGMPHQMVEIGSESAEIAPNRRAPGRSWPSSGQIR